MPNETSPSNTPQFGKAEYAPQPKAAACALCGMPLGAAYYRVKGAIACESCALQAKSQTPKDSHSAYAGALAVGIGAAVLGLILYAAFEIMTGIVIGYAALAVGFLVGKGMKLGARGSGGRKYQITAAVLTYAAVSLSAIPVMISEQIKDHRAETKIERPVQQSPPGDADQPNTTNSSASSPQSQPERMSFGAAIGELILIGLASPFLELQNPLNGAIGLFILYIGIQFAWKLTAGIDLSAVLGPFANRTAAAPAPPPTPIG